MRDARRLDHPLHALHRRSAFFIVVMHMFRGLLYGSYRKPRELIWIFGTLIFLALMAEAFMATCPWGRCPSGAPR